MHLTQFWKLNFIYKISVFDILLYLENVEFNICDGLLKHFEYFNGSQNEFNYDFMRSASRSKQQRHFTMKSLLFIANKRYKWGFTHHEFVKTFNFYTIIYC